PNGSSRRKHQRVERSRGPQVDDGPQFIPAIPQAKYPRSILCCPTAPTHARSPRVRFNRPEPLVPWPSAEMPAPRLATRAASTAVMHLPRIVGVGLPKFNGSGLKWACFGTEAAV